VDALLEVDSTDASNAVTLHNMCACHVRNVMLFLHLPLPLLPLPLLPLLPLPLLPLPLLPLPFLLLRMHRATGSSQVAHVARASYSSPSTAAQRSCQQQPAA
jgi:hypothetical protein